MLLNSIAPFRCTLSGREKDFHLLPILLGNLFSGGGNNLLLEMQVALPGLFPDSIPHDMVEIGS